MVTPTSVVGEMKMGNIVPKAGFEPTSLAFWASVLIITLLRLPWSHLYTHAYLSMQVLASEVSADYYNINKDNFLLCLHICVMRYASHTHIYI